MHSPATPNIVVTQLLRSLNIPPRPALLMALQREMRRDEPDFKKIGVLLRRDAGMAGSLLQTANSAFFGVRRNVTTLEDAIVLIGMNQFGALMTGLITRRVFANGNMMMARFWDVSEKRSSGMGYVARQTRLIPPELAYSFGLFCDIGIPLLKVHFPTYLETLAVANNGATRFTEVEDVRHGINHALVGAWLTESWGIAPEVVHAIRLHHIYETLSDGEVPATIRKLIAANLIVDRAIQEFRGDFGYSEWGHGGGAAGLTLGMSVHETDALCEELKAHFSGSAA
ncbi:MAG TPA: HDOD domain-containing protein [Rhodocyclaceae bacterium]|jgi:HD-like signal output (HDOD) protein|nr:HDOD domain-containing protein [Rhodocyclaceae bacterium]